MNFDTYIPLANTAVLIATYLMLDRRLRHVEEGLSRLQGFQEGKKNERSNG